MSGWFSDEGATRTVALDSDTSFEMRYPLSRADVAAATSIDGLTDDLEIGAAIIKFVPSWTFRDHTGEARPVTAENFVALSLAGQSAIISALAASVRDSISVPNASGAPSQDSSRESASPTHKKTRKPTT